MQIFLGIRLVRWQLPAAGGSQCRSEWEWEAQCGISAWGMLGAGVEAHRVLLRWVSKHHLSRGGWDRAEIPTGLTLYCGEGDAKCGCTEGVELPSHRALG